MDDDVTYTVLGTDNGPSCRCGSTIYRYDVRAFADAAEPVKVAAWCVGCHRMDYFVPRAGTDHTDAAAVSAAHRALR